MPILECVAAAQNSSSGFQGLNNYTALYMTIALAAAVLALVLLIFIRTSSRRASNQSSKQH